jgi:hypothetical protein
MSGGGIIIQRVAVLLTAATDPSFYSSLTAPDKILVDTIDAKDPMTRTQADVMTLIKILHETAKT